MQHKQGGQFCGLLKHPSIQPSYLSLRVPTGRATRYIAVRHVLCGLFHVSKTHRSSRKAHYRTPFALFWLLLCCLVSARAQEGLANVERPTPLGAEGAGCSLHFMLQEGQPLELRTRWTPDVVHCKIHNGMGLIGGEVTMLHYP